MVCVIVFMANRVSLPFGWSEQLNLNTDGLYSPSFFAYLSHIIVTPTIRSLFNRANTLRIKSEFDKAEKLYEKILQVKSDEAEAYWGLILCKYGIEYVEDPATFQ